MRHPAAGFDPRAGGPARSRGSARLTACLLAFFLAVGSGSAFAHGGPPLRLGVTPDSALSAVARLVLVHLREGVGFAVDWREFPDEAALRTAFSAGKIDVAIGVTDAAALPSGAPAAAGCPPETLALVGEALRRSWGGGEPFLLGFPAQEAACARPALIVARAVLEDLRFGILRKESARMAAFINRDDVTAVRSAAERGGERSALAAARAALAAKAKR
jgi:hypothetical protein